MMWHCKCGVGPIMDGAPCPVCDAAQPADLRDSEIARLRAENERLRKAIREAVRYCYDSRGSLLSIREIIDTALQERADAKDTQEQ